MGICWWYMRWVDMSFQRHRRQQPHTLLSALSSACKHQTPANSIAEWVRTWDTLATMKLWRREVVSSIPVRGTIVGWVSSPTRQLVRFSHLNVPFFQNSEFIWNIVPVGSNYRPSAPFLYEVASHVKNCHFGDYYYYCTSRPVGRSRHCVATTNHSLPSHPFPSFSPPPHPLQ